MKAYKGFDKDMTCKGFQYEEGEEYETDTAKCCESGFHACEYPLDCLNYYRPNSSVYHEVELDGTIDEGDKQDSKVCATKIKIGKGLNVADMVKAAIEFTETRTKAEAKANEQYGASSATGDRGASSATGYRGASSATGYRGASSATGYCGASSATGDCSTATVTGFQSVAEAGNETAVAVAWGHESTAKGCKDAYLVLADWEYIGELNENGGYDDPYSKDNWKLNGAKLVQVDGVIIKANTPYRCINGEVKEAE